MYLSAPSLPLLVVSCVLEILCTKLSCLKNATQPTASHLLQHLISKLRDLHHRDVATLRRLSVVHVYPASRKRARCVSALTAVIVTSDTQVCWLPPRNNDGLLPLPLWLPVVVLAWVFSPGLLRMLRLDARRLCVWWCL